MGCGEDAVNRPSGLLPPMMPCGTIAPAVGDAARITDAAAAADDDGGTVGTGTAPDWASEPADRPEVMLPPADRTMCCCSMPSGVAVTAADVAVGTESRAAALAWQSDALADGSSATAAAAALLAGGNVDADAAVLGDVAMLATSTAAGVSIADEVLLASSSMASNDAPVGPVVGGWGVPGADADGDAVVLVATAAAAAVAAAAEAAAAAPAASATSAMSSSIMARPCAWLWWYFRPLANLYFLLQSCSGHSSSTGEMGHGSTVVLLFLAGICTFKPVNGLMRLLVSPVSEPRPPQLLPLPFVPSELSSLDLRFSGRGGRNVVGDVDGVFETVLLPELDDDVELCVALLPDWLPPAPLLDPDTESTEPPAAADAEALPDPVAVGVAGPPTVVRQARPLAPPLRSLLWT